MSFSMNRNSMITPQNYNNNKNNNNNNNNDHNDDNDPKEMKKRAISSVYGGGGTTTAPKTSATITSGYTDGSVLTSASSKSDMIRYRR